LSILFEIDTQTVPLPNLARAKACAASGVVNRLLLTQEHWLDTGRLVHLPAAYNDADNVIETQERAGEFKEC
jgi:hypothetical protein